MAFARKAFKILLILAAIFVAIGLLLPSNTTVSRSVIIQAPAEAVFPHVNNLRKFNDWSPWAAVESSTRFDFEGPAEGVGARMVWSNEHASAGGGSMHITHSEAAKQVRAEMDFGGEAEGVSQFTLTAQSAKRTELLWEFQTEFGWDLFSRYIGLMLDSMIGASYEAGLKTLKQRVEASQ